MYSKQAFFDFLEISIKKSYNVCIYLPRDSIRKKELSKAIASGNNNKENTTRLRDSDTTPRS